MKQGLALAANIIPGDVLEVGVSEAGIGKILVIYKLATHDAMSAALLRLELSKTLSKASTIEFQGLPRASLLAVTVSACPSGFTLHIDLSGGSANNINNGLCQPCPAGYYCSGGSLGPTPCPTASFSLPGSNSSSSCTASVFVIVITAIQVPQSNFTSVLQQKFVSALGMASGIAADRVSILSISIADESIRRLGSSKTRVESQLAATDASSAGNIYNRLNSANFNVELSAQGLPAASLVSITVLASSPQIATTQPWVIALAVIGGFIALLLTVLIMLRIFYNKTNLTEDEALVLKIIDIRRRLALMPKDGYFLYSERRPFWSNGREVQYLRQSHLEAAGRLALSRDFDIMHFDAFCLSFYAEHMTDSKQRYQALSQWILELSEKLINPSTILPEKNASELGCTTSNARFRFFVQKVGKARIWGDDSELFMSLKASAQLFMDQIASDCDLQYKKLCTEPRGQELISLQHYMQQDSQKWLSGKGHCLLRTFSSGPFSSLSQSETTGSKPVSATLELEFGDHVIENKQGVTCGVHTSAQPAIVSRQDHFAVRSSWPL